MSRNVELLLVENVENLGIVGDVVRVKPGFARNYLLPYGLAEAPSEERLAALQERREQVQAELEALRQAREDLHGRLEEIELSITRSCNDQGALYGSVTQRDVADALQEAGYDVDVRAIRLGQPIKRVGSYPVPIQLEKDLRNEITLTVEPDHPIGEEREEMEFDDEGNLITRSSKKKKSDDAPATPPTEDAATNAEAETPQEFPAV